MEQVLYLWLLLLLMSWEELYNNINKAMITLSNSDKSIKCDKREKIEWNSKNQKFKENSWQSQHVFHNLLVLAKIGMKLTGSIDYLQRRQWKLLKNAFYGPIRILNQGCWRPLRWKLFNISWSSMSWYRQLMELWFDQV